MPTNISSITDFINLLSHYSDEDFVLDANKNLFILYQKTLPIYLQGTEGNSLIFIYTPFIDNPTSNKLEIYKKILTAHCLGKITNNAYLGLNHHDQQIYLFKKIELSHSSFEDILRDIHNFSLTYKFLKKTIAFE